MRIKEVSMGFMNIIRGTLNNQVKPKPCNHLFNGKELNHNDILITNKQLKLNCLLIKDSMCGIPGEPRSEKGLATVAAGSRFRVSFYYDHESNVAGVKLIYKDSVDKVWSDEAPYYAALMPDFVYLDEHSNDFEFEKGLNNGNNNRST